MCPPFSNLFLAALEERALDEWQGTAPKAWLRFLDDVLMLWTGGVAGSCTTSTARCPASISLCNILRRWPLSWTCKLQGQQVQGNWQTGHQAPHQWDQPTELSTLYILPSQPHLPEHSQGKDPQDPEGYF